MKKTPKQTVADTFGTRSELVTAICGLLGEGDETRSRLMGVTNKKLLRIHLVAKTVKEEFGGKSGLIDAMAKLQFPDRSPNEGWRTKMESWTVKRLLDHQRSLARKAKKNAA